MAGIGCGHQHGDPRSHLFARCAHVSYMHDQSLPLSPLPVARAAGKFVVHAMGSVVSSLILVILVAGLHGGFSVCVG